MKRGCFLLLFVFFVSIVDAQNIPIKLNKYRNYNYITVYDSTKVDMQESGLSIVKIHKLHKVINLTGAIQLKDIILDYDPLSTKVEFTKVSVWNKNGKERRVSLDKVLDYPAYSHLIYWGARQRMIDLGRLEVGDGIEIEYKKKGFSYALLRNENIDYIPPMRGQFYDIVPFYSSVPCILKYYSIKVPYTKTLKYKISNTNRIKVNKNVKANTTTYTFERHNIIPIKSESNMLSADDVGASVVMTTAQTWNQKSRWFYKVNEDFGSFKSFPKLDDFVSKLIKSAKTEYDTISILTHWVADNIRYCGVSMGKGEGYTLHNAKMTFHDRCGVCKDKAGMLITMLRSAGLESYPAMTMVGSRIKDIPADQFNHCVAIVKVKSGYFKLLDPTWVPFVRELWSSVEQQQNYLPAIPGGADLQKSPVSSPDNHYINIDVTSEVDLEGNLDGTLTLNTEGQSDSSFRSGFLRVSKVNWPYMAKSLVSITDSKMKIDSIYYSNPYNYSIPFQMYVKFSIPFYVDISNEELIYESLATKLFLSKYTHLKVNPTSNNKEYGFKDRCSRLIRISEKVSLPKDVVLVYSPEFKDLSSKSASFKGEYLLLNNNLNLNLKVRLEKRVYSKYEWKAYKAAVEAHKYFIDEPVIFKIK